MNTDQVHAKLRGQSCKNEKPRVLDLCAASKTVETNWEFPLFLSFLDSSIICFSWFPILSLICLSVFLSKMKITLILDFVPVSHPSHACCWHQLRHLGSRILEWTRHSGASGGAYPCCDHAPGSGQCFRLDQDFCTSTLSSDSPHRFHLLCGVFPATRFSLVHLNPEQSALHISSLNPVCVLADLNCMHTLFIVSLCQLDLRMSLVGHWWAICGISVSPASLVACKFSVGKGEIRPSLHFRTGLNFMLLGRMQ